MPDRTEPKLTLISHPICPYMQRVAIALAEKGARFERVYVDPASKRDWFSAISQLGKAPVLMVGEVPLFESAAILEYLEDTLPRPLHPTDPLRRAEHRAWIEFGSSVLDGIRGFCTAANAATFAATVAGLKDKLGQLEQRTAAAPFFDGEHFSLVDAVFGPVFRHFDVFDRIADFGVLNDKPKLGAWRRALAQRPSVQGAVTCDYRARLWTHLAALRSHLSALMPGPEALLTARSAT